MSALRFADIREVATYRFSQPSLSLELRYVKRRAVARDGDKFEAEGLTIQQPCESVNIHCSVVDLREEGLSIGTEERTDEESHLPDWGRHSRTRLVLNS